MGAGKTGLRRKKKVLQVGSIGQETSQACSRLAGTLDDKCPKGSKAKHSSGFILEMQLKGWSCAVTSPLRGAGIPLGVWLCMFAPHVGKIGQGSQQNPKSLWGIRFKAGNSKAESLWDPGQQSHLYKLTLESLPWFNSLLLLLKTFFNIGLGFFFFGVSFWVWIFFFLSHWVPLLPVNSFLTGGSQD